MSDNLIQAWTRLEQVWTSLDKFGQVWTQTHPDWSRLVFQTICSKFGQVGTSLDKFGLVWTSLDQIEMRTNSAMCIS